MLQQDAARVPQQAGTHEVLASGCAGTPARASLGATGAAGAGPELVAVAAVEAEAVAGTAAEAAQTCDAAASIPPSLSSFQPCAHGMLHHAGTGESLLLGDLSL